MNQNIMSEDIGQDPTRHHLSIDTPYLRHQTRGIELIDKPIPQGQNRNNIVSSHVIERLYSFVESATGKVEVYKSAEK
uniref:Uncharacterized protein n=1 Tax=Rhizophora mucronata TaxID=61149 RepID=A0A2P2QMM2_RHIMU